MALTQAWGAMVMLSLLPHLFTPFSRIDFDQPEHRRTYVRGMIKQLPG